MLKIRTRKAFTLLELTVAIVVLGILAALAVPTFSSVITAASNKTAIASAEAWGREVQTNMALNMSESAAVAAANADSTLTGTDLGTYQATVGSLTVSFAPGTVVSAA